MSSRCRCVLDLAAERDIERDFIVVSKDDTAISIRATALPRAAAAAATVNSSFRPLDAEAVLPTSGRPVMFTEELQFSP